MTLSQEMRWAYSTMLPRPQGALHSRDQRRFVIWFDFESYVWFQIRVVLMVRFEIFESSVLSIVIRKEKIGGGWISV